MFQSQTADEYPITVSNSFHGYEIKGLLGNGQFCITVLVEKENSNEQFAAKIISKKYMAQRQCTHLIKNEIAILKSLDDHPNIIKFYEAFDITNQFDEEFIVIITEYCANGDLLDYICNHDFRSEGEKRKILFGIVKAINHLHKRGIFHGDIKPENILLNHQMIPKLCDFGNAKNYLMSNDDDNLFGTLRYAPPEIFKHENFNLMKSDIYSLGITLFAISESDFPFDYEDEDYMIYQIMNGYLSLNPDDELQYIVGQCTKLNPDERCSTDYIIKSDYFHIN